METGKAVVRLVAMKIICACLAPAERAQFPMEQTRPRQLRISAAVESCKYVDAGAPREMCDVNYRERGTTPAIKHARRIAMPMSSCHNEVFLPVQRSATIPTFM
uniref:Secreted protein n=1 Tax=Rhipicephalus zambeziensis TaxID=60191 RepID=A0A224Y8D5_9ACAR